MLLLGQHLMLGDAIPIAVNFTTINDNAAGVNEVDEYSQSKRFSS